MADPTPRWGAPRPTEADTVDPVRDIRALAIFTDIFAVDDQGTLALRPGSTVPAPGKSGRYYKATDSNQLFRDYGTGWDEIALLNNGKLTPTSSDAVANLYRSAAGVLKTDGTFQSVLDQVARVGAATQVTSGAVSGNAGFLFGSASDANLYRSAASSLKTDGTFCATGGFLIGTPIAGPAYQSQQVAGNTVFRNKLLAADSVDTFHILGTGKLEWGAGGGSALDTNLYRAAAGVLKSDSAFQVVGHLTATAGNAYLKAGALYFGAADDTNLYRSAASTLKTDGSLNVGGNINAQHTGGNQVAIGSVTGGGTTVAGLYLGSALDTNIYRNGAAQLATDATFQIRGGAGYQMFSPSETNPRFQIEGSGRIDWGAGGASTVDTYLYRRTAGALKTDSQFEVGGSILMDQASIAGSRIYFGVALDTSLYRSAAGVLTTPGHLIVEGGDVGDAAFDTYRTILTRSQSNIGVLAVGTYDIAGNASGVIAGSEAFYFEPARFSVAGKTTKLRMEVEIISNATQVGAGVQIGFGIFPVTGFPAAAGAAPTVTIGAAPVGLDGNTPSITNPSASNANLIAAEINAPPSNLYVPGIKISGGAMAANSRLSVRITLIVHWV